MTTKRRHLMDEFEVQGNYGQGFEMVTTEETRKAAKEQLKCYNENEPGVAHRIVHRRVPSTFVLNTMKDVRGAFWMYLDDIAPELGKQRRANKSQNDYCADIRMAFVDYVDSMRKEGKISERLANNVTL